MAVVFPFVPSPGGLKSTFSPYTDSPSSPFPPRETFEAPKRSSVSSDTLAPPPSPYPQYIDPSPTDSNGTESTDIEEEIQEQVEEEEEDTSDVEFKDSRPQSREKLVKIDTTYIRSRSNSDEAPASVIHVPSGFGDFTTTPVDIEQPINKSRNRDSFGTTSPSTPDAAIGPDDKRMASVTSLLNTDIPPDKSVDRSTPRAQTRQEAEEEWKRRSRRTSSLEDIPESFTGATETDGSREDSSSQNTMRGDSGPNIEATELKTALNECWTLCNTLANLSSNHRQRMFTMSNKGSTPEYAWQSCWRLCQQLYTSYNSPQSATLPTLNLCREFCQALFDVRQRGDEATDSVLRVSFEMNNHLYNTHDRNLPEAFRERTLDFYITLCHRLIKKRTSLPPDTDALLRSCWSLAETLFNLRTTTRESRTPDDDLLATSIQACWDLSDIFREGWSQIRPIDRSTPRPHQTSFPPSLKSHTSRPGSSLSSSSYHDAPSLPPETPTTIFDDATTTDGESDSEISVPNILVLGTRGTTHHDRWSSNASTLSDYNSEAETSSQRTSSTARANSENAHLVRLRVLILKAAMNVGFNRSTQSLGGFAKGVGVEAFGREKSQVETCRRWKRLVCVDESLGNAAKEGGLSGRVTAMECAEAVVWLGGNEEWRWLGELFRVVFGFGVGEVGGRGGVVVGI